MREWSAREILTELCDGEKRRAVLTMFWNEGDPGMQAAVLLHLAKSLHFRERSLRKLPAEKKADLLASRMSLPELQEALEAGLMLYHTRHARELMSALLDRWNIPHVDGSIEVEEYPVPSEDAVREAIRSVEGRFDQADLLLYLATAGLLMGVAQPGWRDGAWRVVDAMYSNAS